MFTHIIWDFDGTLFDTYPAMSAAFRDTLKFKLGIDEEIDEIRRLMKISMGRAYSHYTEKHGLDSLFFEEYNRLRYLYEMVESKPFDGIIGLCRQIVLNGANNYLFTHRDNSALSLIEKFNMLNLFTGFVTQTDGLAHKPSPEGIYRLIEKHQIPPDCAIMAGDREIDVLSAKNAGISAVLFVDEGKTTDTHADFVISNCREMYNILSLNGYPAK